MMTASVNFAPGQHLLIDFWQVRAPENEAALELMLREAALACGATVLHVYVHRFGNAGGYTGVAILAESHMSIHTWPELDYVALDVFMCGACDPCLSLPILKAFFQPQRDHVRVILRGRDDRIVTRYAH